MHHKSGQVQCNFQFHFKIMGKSQETHGKTKHRTLMQISPSNRLFLVLCPESFWKYYWNIVVGCGIDIIKRTTIFI